MPAIYDEDKMWWILLCTVSDDKIIKEMVREKWGPRTLRYDTVKSKMGIGDNGDISSATTQEQIFHAELQDNGVDLLPFNERLRRLLFSSIVTCLVTTLSEKQKLEELAAGV